MTRTYVVGALLVGGAVQSLAQETAATRELRSWSEEFRPDVVEVGPGAYTAVGYGGSTLSMIVGDDGVVLIDTGSDPSEAARARDAFRRISALPVRGIVYTHGHQDHTSGSSVFVDSNTPPEIWAQARFGVELDTLEQSGLTINRARGTRQFGYDLPPEQRINNGIGPAAYPSRDSPPVPPNRLVPERVEIEIAGVALELVSNPGETEDQLYVWLPERKVLFSGDNFYRCMPNLYAIRGTPYRDVLQWVNAIERLLEKDAESLVGGHTRPIVGKAAVREALTDYRDAIRFIFDKTIEGMNRGLTPDELVDYVQLPSSLAGKPYLQPYYGHTEWAVRSIFSGYLGWFDGNATNLFPLSLREEAERVAALAGGRERLLEALRAAISSSDYQWAANLADYVIILNPDSREVKRLKAQALEALAERTVSAPARNYYLTVAQDLRNDAEQR